MEIGAALAILLYAFLIWRISLCKGKPGPAFPEDEMGSHWDGWPVMEKSWLSCAECKAIDDTGRWAWACSRKHSEQKIRWKGPFPPPWKVDKS